MSQPRRERQEKGFERGGQDENRPGGQRFEGKKRYDQQGHGRDPRGHDEDLERQDGKVHEVHRDCRGRGGDSNRARLCLGTVVAELPSRLRVPDPHSTVTAGFGYHRDPTHIRTNYCVLNQSTTIL